MSSTLRGGSGRRHHPSHWRGSLGVCPLCVYCGVEWWSASPLWECGSVGSVVLQLWGRRVGIIIGVVAMVWLRTPLPLMRRSTH